MVLQDIEDGSEKDVDDEGNEKDLIEAQGCVAMLGSSDRTGSVIRAGTTLANGTAAGSSAAFELTAGKPGQRSFQKLAGRRQRRSVIDSDIDIDRHLPRSSDDLGRKGGH